MSITVNAPEAAAQLIELLSQVRLGEEIIIAEAGVPIARLVSIVEDSGPRIPGMDKGKVIISPDFNDPLPPELLNAFYGDSDS
jgi:prevent-host-death family protein